MFELIEKIVINILNTLWAPFLAGISKEHKKNLTLYIISMLARH